MTTEEKLNHFLEACVGDATEKSEDMLVKFIDYKKNEYEEHTKKASEEAKFLVKAQTEELHRNKNKELSKGQFEIKQEFSKKSEELKDMLFVEVKDILEKYMNTAEYNKVLLKQIEDAKKIAKGESFTVYLDPADEDRVSSLKVASGIFLEISKTSFGGGTKIYIPSRNILIDNSFDSKLAAKRASFTFDV